VVTTLIVHLTSLHLDCLRMFSLVPKQIYCQGSILESCLHFTADERISKICFKARNTIKNIYSSVVVNISDNFVFLPVYNNFCSISFQNLESLYIPANATRLQI
jgi:hypothetical protein